MQKQNKSNPWLHCINVTVYKMDQGVFASLL